MQLITLILVGFTGRHPCALTTMIVQCSYYQWKNFFEALDKEAASTCRTIAKKNEHFEALGKEAASTCRTTAKKNEHVLKNSTSKCLSSNFAAFSCPKDILVVS